MPDVQQQTRHSAGTSTTGTIVVGVDGSDGAITAVRWAAGHARATGARLRLIHAVRETVSATIALPVPVSFTGAAPPRRRRAHPGKRAVARATAEARPSRCSSANSPSASAATATTTSRSPS